MPFKDPEARKQYHAQHGAEYRERNAQAERERRARWYAEHAEQRRLKDGSAEVLAAKRARYRARQSLTGTAVLGAVTSLKDGGASS